jgi:4-hydroxy-4-methyl-2-oxoglutarate aldolase
MLEDPPLLTVRRAAPRIAAADIEPFHDCVTGWLADAQGGRGALDAIVKPLAPEVPAMARFVGTALTCWCGPNDNLALLAAVALAEPGDVIVAATDGFAGAGMAGDLVAGMARNKGVAAIVTDGMVRDRAGLVAVGLPVFCRGVTPNSCVRSGPGSVGLPVVAGGVPVRPGVLAGGPSTVWSSCPRRGLAPSPRGSPPSAWRSRPPRSLGEGTAARRPDIEAPAALVPARPGST